MNIPLSPTPIRTVAQLKAVLKQMRTALGLSQAGLGDQLGVKQERVSKIEAHPERMKVDQLLTMVLALQGELLIRRNQTTHRYPPLAPDHIITLLRRYRERSADKPDASAQAAVDQWMLDELRGFGRVEDSASSQDASTPRVRW